jgi:hypothetical protein
VVLRRGNDNVSATRQSSEISELRVSGRHLIRRTGIKKGFSDHVDRRYIFAYLKTSFSDYMVSLILHYHPFYRIFGAPEYFSLPLFTHQGMTPYCIIPSS